ncbi:hypothetical protein CWATWH8502_3157 [Crocosphaera watsonii WH 8502]|uniref:Uncharacterized protein n=1 Tax=Crocosphaera watsonii WH 8502 TaxID=423474 RepID=T2I8D3_CROWT|nr:hypothetical protein CWATWH8502_3157 [Crocosphaera watsonii WH 8502]
MDSLEKKRRRSLARKVDNEVEKIIHKVMTNEGVRAKLLPEP